MDYIIDTNAEHERGKEIAKCGDFHEIRRLLEKEGILEKNVNIFKNHYQNFFREKEMELPENIWETIAILGLYDGETLEHSIRTFSIAKDIATKKLIGPHGEELVLLKYIEEAGVSLYNLCVAALGHDIGKTKLPSEIIHNCLTDAEMENLLIGMIRCGKPIPEMVKKTGFTEDELREKSDEEIIAILYQKGIRAVNIVPIHEAFPNANHSGLISILKARGFSGDETIMAVTRIHESEGEKIFNELGEPVIADLVGHHHNYKKHAEHEVQFIMNIPLLKDDGYVPFFGVYNVIKIADSMDSLQSKRPYKEGMSKVAALAELAHQALTNRLEKCITYIYIHTEYEEIKQLIESAGSHIHDEKSVEIIERFLSQTKAEFATSSSSL